MFPCPHCGKTIEVETPIKARWSKLDNGRGHEYQGLGNLILIAIIVAVFSRGEDPSNAIRALRYDIQALEQKIDAIEVKPVAAPQADAE